MQTTALILMGIVTLINTIGIIVLGISLKKRERQMNEIRRKTLELYKDSKEYLGFANHCFKNFCYVKDAFRRIRRELINKDILSRDFEYIDEDEAIEEFIENFLNS